MHVGLNDQNDVFLWNLHQHGQYTVHSLYLALINNGMENMNKQLWRLEVPLKIKKFMWYMRTKVVNNVAFIYMMNLYNIYFLIGIMRDLFGD
jgi:ABC-type proline/glycine betaine transport system permease subunit